MSDAAWMEAVNVAERKVYAATAERDAARANARRLAEAIDRYHGNPSDVHSRREDADCDLCVARAAHDALTGSGTPESVEGRTRQGPLRPPGGAT